MAWQEVIALLGPGVQWNLPRQRYLDAIAEADAAGKADVAGHLRIMLERRDAVMQDKENPAQEQP